MIPICDATDISDTTVYIAGKWEAHVRLQEMANELRQGGYHVTSSWLNRPLNQGYKVSDSFDQAELDLDEIDQCNLFILDTLDENPTGGANVEFGYALAHSAARLLIVVGPQRNIFHPLAGIHFPDWPAVLEVLLNPHVLYGV